MKKIFSLILLFTLTVGSCWTGIAPHSTYAADQRAQYTEKAIGANHPTLADTINRLTLVEHNNDGTHDLLTQVTDPWFDIRAYGAIDGSDSTTAIQAALDAADAAGGGAVYIPDGIWYLSAPLTIGDTTTLFGEGKKSLIRALNALEANMLINKDSSGGNIHIEIRDLAFDGNRAGQSSTGGIIHLDNVDKFSIHDIWLLNAFNDAIFIDNSFYGRIKNNYAEGAGADNYTVHNTFDLIMDGNISYLAGQTGTGGGGFTVITASGRIIINGNSSISASGTNGNGFVLQGASNAIVSNNIAFGNAASGFQTDTGNGRHSFTGNQSVGNTGRGFYVLNSENSFSGANIASGNGLHGISILSPGTRNIISDSFFINNTGEGIENTGSETTITGNTATFNDFNGIKNNGADDAIVSSNVCRNNSQAGAGSYSGLRVIDSSDGIYTANRCLDTQGTKTQTYGVRETGTSDRNIYQANNFRDNLTAPYILVGSNNVVQDNITDESLDVASVTTTTLPDNGDYFNITGTTTITSVTASRAERVVILKFAGILTFTDGSNLKIAGDFVTTADDTITLVSDGTNWIEASRSIN